jgi:Asp-tRNA(Asn)/Glu-tRNA(Gln) amidotransferase A subunit family amidase
MNPTQARSRRAADLCDRDATDLRRLLAQGETSPRELVDACIARIAQVNPALNAIVADDFARAREAALALRVADSGGGTTALLHGLPVAIKDLTDTAGLRTTYGSPRFRDHVPAVDEGVVTTIRGHGGIVLGKTNTPEFGIGGNTVNRVYGATRNPFDPVLTCGGSSGGAAVAVATGMVPLATGTDSGGSLRNPAAFCGIVGFRPTPGLVPSERRANAWSPMGVHGPMARTVADAALLLQAMALHDVRDPIGYPQAHRFDALAPVRTGDLALGFCVDLGFAPVARSVEHVFRRKIGRMAPLFARCEPVDFAMDTAERVSWILRCLHVLVTHRQRLASGGGEELEPNLRENLRAAQRLPADDIAWALAEQARLYRAFERSMGACDVLAVPAAAIPPFPVDSGPPASIDGVAFDHYAHWMAITYGITLVGHPSLVIPCGRDDAGMPFGIQLVARPHQDFHLLSAGHAIERAFARDEALARPIPVPGANP